MSNLTGFSFEKRSGPASLPFPPFGVDDKMVETQGYIHLSARLRRNGSGLERSGLVENVCASRPEHLPGENRIYVRRSTAHALLRHAGTWVGGDLEKCIRDVYAYRAQAEF